MSYEQARTLGRRTLRLAGILTLAGGVLVLGLLGWRWRASATVGQVTVHGTQHALPDTLRRLAVVDSGATMSNLDLVVVGDRVERHPWVKDVEVGAHWMRRTLAITVTERTPAGLAVDGRGRPSYYLARTGHAMPIPDSTGYDVPLVRGLDAEYRPVGTVAPRSVQQVLSALSDNQADDLVAEIDVQPDSSIDLVTKPLEPYGALTVRLGTGNAEKKLRTLNAFARQALSRTSLNGENTIDEVDLRFAGQIITR